MRKQRRRNQFTIGFSSDLARFLSRVNKDGPIPEHVPHLGNCWQWLGALGRTHKDAGYGIFGMCGDCLKAHRAAWQLFVGEIPEKAHVCHHCDNPSCVRPEHLYLGNHATNMKDKQVRYRARCAKSKLSRLNWDAVHVIRALSDLGLSRVLVGALFNMAAPHVSNIVRNKCWQLCDDPAVIGDGYASTC